MASKVLDFLGCFFLVEVCCKIVVFYCINNISAAFLNWGLDHCNNCTTYSVLNIAKIPLLSLVIFLLFNIILELYICLY